MEGLLFTQGDFDSCPIACVVGGIVISVSKVLAEELWSRAENGEEKPWWGFESVCKPLLSPREAD